MPQINIVYCSVASQYNKQEENAETRYRQWLYRMKLS